MAILDGIGRIQGSTGRPVQLRKWLIGLCAAGAMLAFCGEPPAMAGSEIHDEVESLWRQFEWDEDAAQAENEAASRRRYSEDESLEDDSAEHDSGDASSEVGYLFVDGQYLAPPYELSKVDGKLVVNGQPVSCRLPQADRAYRRLGRFRSTDDVSCQQLADWLDQDSVLVALPDQPLVVLGDPGSRYDLFTRLMKHPTRMTDVAFSEQLPQGLDRGMWRDWIARFTPTPGFIARAGEVISEYETSETRARAEIAATRRLNSLAYPLTVCGMIATTLAMGHLLSNRPPKVKSRLEMDASPETLSAVVWSLGLVVGLSALDLVWTILASQANQMRELNPLGSEFINDPLKLVLFKTAAIGMAVGLLFALRRYRQAQLGAWWAVLICTLLTVRWLAFNSMNVA